MKNKSDKNKSASRRFGLLKKIIKYVLILALIALALLLIQYVNNMSLNSITSIFEGEDEITVDNRDDIYNSLSSADRYSDYSLVHHVTPEELTLIISEFTLPTGFEMTVTKSYYSAQSEQTRTGIFKYNSPEFSMMNYDGDILVSSVTGDGSDIVYTDELRERSQIYKQTDNFSYEEACELPSLRYLTDKCDEIINGVLSDYTYEISLVAKDDESLYKVVFEYSDIEQREEYYINAETEMITAVYSYIEDKLIYSIDITDYKSE